MKWFWFAISIIAAASIAFSGSIQKNAASISQMHLAYTEGVPYVRQSNDTLTPYLAAVRAFYAEEYDTTYALLNIAPERSGLTQWFRLRALSGAGRWEAVLDSADLSQYNEVELFATTFVAHEDEMTVSQRTRYLAQLQSDPVHLLAYARQLLRAQKFAIAAEIAHTITDRAWSSDARLLEARAYFYLRDWARAREILSELVAVDQSPMVLYWHGRTRFEQGEMQAGLDDIRTSLEKMPERANLDYYVAYARLLWVTGQCGAAIEFLTATIAEVGAPGNTVLLDALLEAQKRC